MKRGMILSALGAGALSVAACSASVPVQGAGDPSAASSVSSSREPRWTAIIQNVAQTRFNMADTTRDRSYGSAQWSPDNRPTLSRVSVVFNYGGTERELSWAILIGNCGSASLPVIPISNFPELEVGSGGHAQLEAPLTLEFPISGSYHIEVYRDRRGGAEFLVACGNLKYSNG